ncbi:hypothetical protein DL96DRAFT_1621021 [Flagelloscypha sp. PMI_526]|nr:hypothetical protein DL96DRAFT_1621021 [Flagelloscypha sp. PMI_526]
MHTSEDAGIVLPWNYVRLDEGYNGITPSWTTRLTASRFTEVEILFVQARRPSMFLYHTVPIWFPCKPPSLWAFEESKIHLEPRSRQSSYPPPRPCETRSQDLVSPLRVLRHISAQTHIQRTTSLLILASSQVNIAGTPAFHR